METPTRTTKRGGHGGADSRRTPSPKRQPPNANDDHAVSWSDLTPELIGRVAIFLAMGNSDLMNLLLRVGPDTAAIVRKTYLQGNDYYMVHCLEEDVNWSNFQYWLDVNEKEWKERCQGVKSGSRVHSVFLSPEQVNEIRMAVCGDGFIACRFDHLRIDLHGADLERVNHLHRFGFPPVLLAVGNTKILPCTPDEQVRSVFDGEKPDEDGKIVLNFIRLLDHIFASPLFVISNGLTNVLRYLVDEGLVTVNDSISSANSEQAYPLLCYAAMNDDSCSTLEYLLSCEGIDVNIEVYDGIRLVHFCALFSSVPASRLKVLLRHPDIDLNVRDLDGCTALVNACLQTDVSKVKVLMESGADPDVPTAGGNTPIDILRFNSQERSNSEDKRQKSTELLAYLESYRNARNDA